jgi:hypothetical protein
MNERIKELLLKVVHMQGEDGEYLPSLVTEEHIEKFAELIIKKCCKMMIDLEIKYPANLTVRDIKEHFGVK